MFRIIAFLLVVTTQHIQAQTYAGVHLAVRHIKPLRHFDEKPFGGLVGVRFGERLQYGAEFGWYNNSYSETTRYGLAFVDYPVGPVRVGVWAGAFEYANLIPWAKRAGIPNSGDFIGLAGVQVKAGGFTLRALPGGNKSDLIITLSASVPFGGE